MQFQTQYSTPMAGQGTMPGRTPGMSAAGMDWSGEITPPPCRRVHPWWRMMIRQRSGMRPPMPGRRPAGSWDLCPGLRTRRRHPWTCAMACLRM